MAFFLRVGILFGLCLDIILPVIAQAAEGSPTSENASNRTEGASISKNALVVFVSPGCDECRWMKQNFLVDFCANSPSSPPPIYFVDIDKKSGYELLLAVERTLEVSGEHFPVLLAGTQLLYGKASIKEWGRTVERPFSSSLPRKVMTRLESSLSLLNRYEAPAEKFSPQEHRAKSHQAAKADGESQQITSKPALPKYKDAHVLYFETPGCQACSRVNKQLSYAQKLHPEKKVTRFNVLNPKTRMLQYAVAKRHDIPDQQRLKTPMLVSDQKALYGKQITDKQVQSLLHQSPHPAFWQKWHETKALAEAKGELKYLSENLTIPIIFGAGLLDGINPCAFAVMLFLISYLCVSSEGGKRYILMYGLLFCGGVFTCYFLLGLGFIRILNVIQQWENAFNILLFSVGAVCIVIALAAYADVWIALRSGAESMRFGIPKGVHRAIHYLIRKSVAKPLLGLGAAGLGIVVSAIELVCTGQVYLPILFFINSTTLNAKSLQHLVLYNTAFIMPLAVIVAAGTLGAGSQKLQDWSRRHASVIRGLTGTLVLGLGVSMFFLAVH